MIKSDKGKKVFGVIPILAIIVSVFGGVVSAVDLSGGGVTQSVTDAEIQSLSSQTEIFVGQGFDKCDDTHPKPNAKLDN